MSSLPTTTSTTKGWAEQTGIGRATLYKYFPDVESILAAWHERHVAGHLQQLAELGDQARDPHERLEAVLEAYALICHEREHHGAELAALLHGGEHVSRAKQHLIDLVRGLLAETARSGNVRDDVAPDELAAYCLHALEAASSLASKSAVRRLVTSPWLDCATRADRFSHGGRPHRTRPSGRRRDLFRSLSARGARSACSSPLRCWADSSAIRRLPTLCAIG